jgi:peptidoglycan hydrolase-like protein with peptidoglycan-binding domain
MNRTLTAAVALAAAFGIAGLAHAQTTASPSTQPGAPNMTTPTTPPSMPNSAASTNPSSMNPSAVSTAPMTPANPAGMNPSTAATASPATSPYVTSPLANNPSATTNSSMMGSKQATMSQSNIQQAQQQLKAQGLYRGAIDGVMGPRTEQALSQFQRRNGLPESAELDQQTLYRLNGSYTGAGTTAPMGSIPSSSTPSPSTRQQPSSGTRSY